MIEQIERLYLLKDFSPFTICTSGGERFEVSSRDRVALNPQRNRVVVFFDDGTNITLTAPHIIGVVAKTVLPA